MAGTEICYDADLVEQLKRGELLTYGRSRSILVEPLATPTAYVGTHTVQPAGRRLSGGAGPPRAHRRSAADPNRLLPLIERGVLMQITAEALLGEQGQRLRTTAETLLTHGWHTS